MIQNDLEKGVGREEKKNIVYRRIEEREGGRRKCKIKVMTKKNKERYKGRWKERERGFALVEFATQTGQARDDQLRNPIKVGHVSKCGAIPKVSNFLV